jgi:Lon protease-like protein
MSGDNPLPADFGGPVRLFPLPNLVLFPYVIQPLHIFEPRYRELMTDALQTDRLIAMATLRPGWESEYHNRPSIFPTICIGRIIKDERLPDGRYDLLLHGMSRARVLEETPAAKLYRSARVQLLEDVPIASPAVANELRTKLREYMNAWFATQTVALAQLRKLLESDLPLGTLCDVFSFTLPLDIEMKQQLLDQVDVEQRTRRLLEYLGPRVPTKLVLDTPRKYPPEFSSN